MVYDDYKSMQDRHNEITDLYMQKIPTYKRGRIKRLLQFLAFVAWCFIWFESAYRYFHISYVDFDPYSPALYLMGALIFAVSVAIFKPYKLWTDKNFFGKIEKIETGSQIITKRGQRFSKHLAFCYTGYRNVTIRSNSGHLVTKRLPYFQKFDDIYDIDSSVSVLSGIKLPVPMDITLINDDMALCTKCGSIEMDYRQRCSVCHEILWYKRVKK